MKLFHVIILALALGVNSPSLACNQEYVDEALDQLYERGDPRDDPIIDELEYASE